MSQKQPQTLAKHKWLALCGLVVAMSVIMIDGTIMNVALPTIMRTMNLTATKAEWIVTIYSLVFCALLVTFGRIADSLGRKKTLIIGLLIFSVGAVIGALANNYSALMIARFVQGIGGALILPPIMSTMNEIYVGTMRIIAFAMFGSFISAMSAIGPYLGGLFVTYSTWRWVFWIDIPFSVVAAGFALFAVPETFGAHLDGFDIIGFITSCIGFGTLTFGLIEGKTDGWWYAKDGVTKWFGLSPIPWYFLIALITLTIFSFYELHAVNTQKQYLMDLHLFKVHSFRLSVIMQIIFRIGMVGLIFLLPQFLQNVLGMSAVDAGAVTCFMGLSALVAGAVAVPLVKLTSTKIVVSFGMILMAIGSGGLAALLHMTINPNPWAIRGWLMLFGLGLGLSSAQLSAILMNGIPNKLGGQASSIQSTASQISSALAIGVIGSILSAVLGGSMPAALNKVDMPATMRSAIQNSIIVTQGDSIPIIEESKEFTRMPRAWQKSFDNNVKSGFSEGISRTTYITSGIMVVTFLLSLGLPGKKKLHEEALRTQEINREQGFADASEDDINDDNTVEETAKN